MNKSLIMIGLVFCLFTVTVSGALLENLMAYYKLDTNGKYEDVFGISNGTAVGSPNFLTTAKLLGGYYFDGNDAIDITHTNDINIGNSNFTVNFWFNGTDDLGELFVKRNGATYIRSLLDNDGQTYVYFQMASGGSTCSMRLNNNSMLNKQWHMLTFVYVRTPCTSSGIYLDGVKTNPSFDGSTDGLQPANTQPLSFAYYQPGGSSFSANSYDEIGVWNRSLTQSEITSLYNSGVGISYNFTVTVPPQPTMTLYNSLTNNTINYKNSTLSFYYNGTFTATTNTTANCSFFQQNVFNKTIEIDLNLNNRYNITLPVTETLYNLSFNCSNAETNASSGKYYYKIDLIPPISIIDFSNNSIYPKGEFIIFKANYSDTNLYWSNITFKNLINGSIIYNSEKNLSGSNKSSQTVVYEAYRTGNYSVKSEVWDSHTGNLIKDFTLKNLSNGIQIESFRITSDQIKSTVTTRKTDRYEFGFIFNESIKNLAVFNVNSPNKLYYLGRSKYKGHFVDFEAKKWLDFENDYLIMDSVEQLDENSYKVYMKPNPDLCIEVSQSNFNSVGDLNYEEQTYYYKVIPEVSINNTALESLSYKIGLLEGEINMMVWLIVWGVLMFLGYKMIYDGNTGIGFLLLGSSLIIDFVFLMENLVSDLAISLMFGSLLIGIPLTLLFVKQRINRRYKIFK